MVARVTYDQSGGAQNTGAMGAYGASMGGATGSMADTGGKLVK